MIIFFSQSFFLRGKKKKKGKPLLPPLANKTHATSGQDGLHQAGKQKYLSDKQTQKSAGKNTNKIVPILGDSTSETWRAIQACVLIGPSSNDDPQVQSHDCTNLPSVPLVPILNPPKKGPSSLIPLPLVIPRLDTFPINSPHRLQHPDFPFFSSSLIFIAPTARHIT